MVDEVSFKGSFNLVRWWIFFQGLVFGKRNVEQRLKLVHLIGVTP